MHITPDSVQLHISMCEISPILSFFRICISHYQGLRVDSRGSMCSYWTLPAHISTVTEYLSKSAKLLLCSVYLLHASWYKRATARAASPCIQRKIKKVICAYMGGARAKSQRVPVDGIFSTVTSLVMYKFQVQCGENLSVSTRYQTVRIIPRFYSQHRLEQKKKSKSTEVFTSHLQNFKLIDHSTHSWCGRSV